MGSCRTGFLALYTVVLALVAGTPLICANPLASEFTRIPIGVPVVAWLPVDLYGTGTWQLAILISGPSRIGVFDPIKAEWIDGPRPAPIWGGGWGAGDWNQDGYLEYVYIKADSIRYINTRTQTDSLLWIVDYRPIDMTVWGHSPQGGPTVALQRSLGTYPWGGPYKWRIYDLFTGAFVKACDGGGSALRVLHEYPVVTAGSRLILHESHARISNTPMTGMNYYYQSLWVFNEDWEVSWHADLPGALDYNAPAPLWWLRFVDYCPSTSSDNGHLVWMAISPHLPSYVGDLSLTGYQEWLSVIPPGEYGSFACYDVRQKGYPELALPLTHKAGWEIRSLTTGVVLDTLIGMPQVDLAVGPLQSADYQERNLFYFADSSLYIWNMPTAVDDDQTPASGLPSEPWLTAHPNPFNSTVRLTWSACTGATTLDIYNILGQQIRTYDLAHTSGSSTSVEWDATDNSGRPVPSGIYFAYLEATGKLMVKKLVLLK